MKKTAPNKDGDLRSEYDFRNMKGGVHGKYAARFREETNVVLLEPDVAEAFPNEDAVNQALRGVLATARAVRSRGGLAEKSLRKASPSGRRKSR